MVEGERKVKSLEQRNQELISNIQQIQSELDKLKPVKLSEVSSGMRSCFNQTSTTCTARLNIDSLLVPDRWTYSVKFTVKNFNSAFVGLFPLATYYHN